MGRAGTGSGCGVVVLDAPQIVRLCLADALPVLTLAEKCDRQKVGLKNIFHGCEFFGVRDNTGRPVMAYALMICGRELWIQGAAGHGHGHTQIIHDSTLKQAQKMGMESVGFMTRRAGAVAKAERLGFVVDGHVMRRQVNG